MIKKFFYATLQIKNNMSHPHNLAHGHYALEFKENYVRIFTTRPILGIKNRLVSNITIDGNKKPQYLSGYVYKTDSQHVVLADVPEVQQYLKENPTLMFDVIKESHELPLIEIAIELIK